MTVAPAAAGGAMIRAVLVDEIDRLRRGLDAAGYTAAAIRDRLGASADEAGADDVPLLLRRLGTDAESTTIRLLFLQLPVTVDDLTRVLGDEAPDDLVALGLASKEDGLLRPRARLVPHRELLLASDGFPAVAGAGADHVSGLTQSARVCANLTPRGRVRATLDLGTGCGTHALLAARHSHRVVATDVNPRALAFAAVNARLNGIDNVELRQGSLFEPVAGERFDLIVSNPPFVVSPEQRFTYRDGGVPGDGFSAQLVEAAPAHLAEGGFAALLASWIADGSADPFARPRGWVEGSGCDAWLVAARTLDPLGHAAAWSDGDDLEEWAENLRQLGADRVVEGAVILRRRSAASNWVRSDTAPPETPEPASEHIRRVFAANDRLAELDDGGLLAARLELAPPHRIEASFSARAGRRVPETTRIRLLDGLRFAAEIDPHTAELLVRLDGERTLQAALLSLTQEAGLNQAEVEMFSRQAAAIAREMLGLGFLVFAESTGR